MTEEIIDGYIVRTYPNGTVERIKYSPPVEPEPEITRTLTKLQFRNRFTTEEKVALYTAAESNVLIRVFLDDVAAAQEIDLDYPATVEGVHALEAFGIIDAGRATEILT